MFSSLTLIAQQPLFLYRTNGDVQVLWSDDIDSMYVSCYDINHIEQNYPVTQEIKLKDSLIRIPLSEIDRLSVTPPPTVMKEGTIDLENGLRDYIVNRDSFTLYVREDIPENLKPKPGDKLCFAFCDDLFPNGFAAQVVTLKKDNSRYIIQCETTSLSEVFDTFIYSDEIPSEIHVSRASQSNEQTTPCGQHFVPQEPIKFAFALPEIGLGASVSAGFFTGGLRGSTNSHFNLTASPDLWLRRYLVIMPGMPVDLKCGISGYTDIEYDFTLNGTLESELKIHSPSKPLISIGESYEGDPIMGVKKKATFVDAKLLIGLFLRGTLEATWEMKGKQRFNIAGTFNWASDGRPALKNTFQIIPDDTNKATANYAGLYVSGNIEFGVFFDAGFEVCNVIEGSFGSEAGISTDLQIAIPFGESKTEPTKVYETVKNNHLTISPYFRYGAGAALNFFNHHSEGKEDLTLNLFASWEGEKYLDPIVNLRLVPEFRHFSAKRIPDNLSSVELSSEVRGNCIFPIELGYAAIDKNGNRYDVKNKTPYSLDWHQVLSEQGQMFVDKIENLKTVNDYKVYPTLTLFDNDTNIQEIDMLASPETRIGKTMEVQTHVANLADNNINFLGRFDGYDRKTEVPEFGIIYSIGSTGNWNKLQGKSISNDESGILFSASLDEIESGEDYYYAAFAKLGNDMVTGDTLKVETAINEPIRITSWTSLPPDAVYEYTDSGVSKYISFREKVKTPDLVLTDSIIEIGYILYKDDIEVNRYSYNKESTYYDGTMYVVYHCYENDLTIDAANYVAIADKSKFQIKVFYKKIEKNGSIITVYSSNLKDINWVYDVKPFLDIYDFRLTSQKNKEYEYSPDENPRYDGSLRNYYFIRGSFWIKSWDSSLIWKYRGEFIPGDDLIDGSGDDLILGHSMGVYYNTPPKRAFMHAIDVNGKDIYSNIIDIPCNSDGTISFKYYNTSRAQAYLDFWKSQEANTSESSKKSSIDLENLIKNSVKIVSNENEIHYRLNDLESPIQK